MNLQEFPGAYLDHKRSETFYRNSSSGKEKLNAKLCFHWSSGKLCPTSTWNCNDILEAILGQKRATYFNSHSAENVDCIELDRLCVDKIY